MRMKRIHKFFICLGVMAVALVAPLGVQSVSAAIAFDANTTASTCNPCTSNTVAHTGTGSNLAAVVATLGGAGSDTITGVTYNGSAMAKVNVIAPGAVQNRYSTLWFLAGVSSGAVNVVATSSGSDFIRVYISTYSGVENTTYDAQATKGNTAATTSPSVTLTTVATDAWAVAYFSVAGSGTFSNGTNYAERDATTADGRGYGDSGVALGAGGSKTLTATNDASEEYVAQVVSFAPAAGAGATPYRRRTIIISQNGGLPPGLSQGGGGNTYVAHFNGGLSYLEDSSVSDNLDNFSGEIWVRTASASVGQHQIIMGKQYQYNGTEGGWTLYLSGAATTQVARIQLLDTTNTCYYNAGGTTKINDGEWHSLQFSWDEATDALLLYVDNAAEGSVEGCWNNYSYANARNFRIGGQYAYSDANRTPFNGDMDDVRLWNTTRTPTELSTYRTTQLTGSESGLIAYYKMNNSFNDSTSNGYNLTASGSVTFGTNVPF